MPKTVNSGDVNKTIDRILLACKQNVKRYVKDKIRKDCPDKIDKLTNRILLESLIYLQGCADMLRFEIIEPPVNEDELQQFLFDKTYKYIYSRL